MTTPKKSSLTSKIAKAAGRTVLKGAKAALLPNPDPATCNGYTMVGSRKKRCGKKLRGNRSNCGNPMCAATTMED